MSRLAWLALAATACRPATQVTVDVTTDVACTAQRGTSVTVGRPGAVDGKPPGAVTTECSADAPENRIGSVVLVPGDDDDAFGLAVVLGVDRGTEECVEAGYSGCIVARRAMSFVDHTELLLPVSLAERCKGIACDPSTTCVDGECVDATVRDPGSCTDATACDDTSLGGKPGGSGGAAGSGGGGAAGGAGGSGGGGGMPTATCGGPGVLIDDFGTVAMSPAWIVEGSASVASEAGGVLTLMPKDAQLVNRVAYRSRHAVDLSGRAMRVTVPAITAQADQRTSMTLGFDEGATGAWISVENGQLMMSLLEAGEVIGAAVTSPYDSGEHVVWQLREQAGTLRWETSADGTTWTTHRMAPMPDFLVPAYMYLRTGAAPGVQTKEAVFDDFNAGIPAEPWCPISTLHDSFDDDELGPAWWPSTITGACYTSESGGVVGFSGDPGSICQRRSAAAFDLQEDGVTLELAMPVGLPPGATAFLEVANGTGDTVRFSRDDQLCAMSINGSLAGSLGNDPAWRFWRLERASTDLTAKASADGTTWFTVTASNVPIDVSAVDVRFGLEMSARALTPGLVSVTAINP